jgi:hypothetical protein
LVTARGFYSAIELVRLILKYYYYKPSLTA